jgi:hypothetical protein
MERLTTKTSDEQFVQQVCAVTTLATGIDTRVFERVEANLETIDQIFSGGW